MEPRRSGPPATDRLADPPRGGGWFALALLVAGALVFSNAYGVRRAAGDGLVAQRAEATLAAADLAASSLTHAVLRATSGSPGLEEAVDEARRGLAEATRRGSELREVLPNRDPALEEVLTDFRSSGEAVVTALDEGRVREATRILETEFAERHRTLVGSLALLRDRHAATLGAAGELAGSIANLTRFGLAVAIPGMAILGYGWLVRRRVRRIRRLVDARWEEAGRLAVAKEELVAEVTDELQEALYGSYRLAQRLAEQGAMGPEEAARTTAGLMERSEELARRTENLLAAAQAGTGRLELAEEELDFLGELGIVLAGGHRAQGIDVTCPPARVRGDRRALRQVLRNLLAEAHRRGGRVSVRGTFQDGELVCIVAATRPEEDAQGTTEGPAAPEGVELAPEVARVLLERMGGRLARETDEEESRFVLRLPGGPAREPRRGEEDASIERKRSPSPARGARG